MDKQSQMAVYIYVVVANIFRIAVVHVRHQRLSGFDQRTLQKKAESELLWYSQYSKKQHAFVSHLATLHTA